MDVDISITRAQPPKARNAVSAQLVVPGEIITTESGYMRYENIARILFEVVINYNV
jgi:hypothetical protein